MAHGYMIYHTRMDFTLTHDEASIRQEVRRMAERFPTEYWRKCDSEHRFPWDFYEAFAAGGWLGMCLPEKYGGGGLGISEAAVLLQEIARSGAGMNGCTALHFAIFGMQPVLNFGSEELRNRILPRIVKGDLHVAFSITEPNAGSDTTRITTFAKREGDHYIVTGRKVWTSKAKESEKMVLLARTTKLEDCERKTDGMTLFLADIDPNTVDVREIEKMGRNAVDSNELFIDGLRIAEADRIGDEGRGFKYLLDGLNSERILIANEALGVGYAALDRAVEYAKDRIVFNRPIGMNQAIQFPLAEALTRLEAAELMARKAAWLYDRGEPCGKEANMAKFLCADAGFYAADRAVQTLGGFGYAKEYDVERYFREARLIRIVPVSQEMMLAYLGQHTLGLPKSY